MSVTAPEKVRKHSTLKLRAVNRLIWALLTIWPLGRGGLL